MAQPLPWLLGIAAQQSTTMARDVHITGIFVVPKVGILPSIFPRQQKNCMDTVNMHIFTIDGARGMIPLPQNTISALNRISSEPGLLKIPCGPWHLGQMEAAICQPWE